MINQIVKQLHPDDLKLLMLAFNNEERCVIELDDSRIIAVHVTELPGIETIEQQGVWLYGKRISTTNDSRIIA